MTREEIIYQLESILGVYEILTSDGVNSDILDYDEIEAIREAIKALEQEPKIGHWIVEIWNYREHYTCSECYHVVKYEPCYHYCPYCGAKMFEKED